MTTFERKPEPYVAPAWTADLEHVPTTRISLARTPTPIQPWTPEAVASDIELYAKRDDQTGITLSGNKARKLEFLLAEAIDRGADTLITAGGIQSNHCRATAVAGREMGMDCHLVLNAKKTDQDPGLAGNLLLDRLVGAHLHLYPYAEWQENEQLMERLAEELRDAGRKPYVIPVGGSNATGTWGYIEAAREIVEQAGDAPFDDIVFACGSGGTAAGLALGMHLQDMPNRVHAVNVCKDAGYFYEQVQLIFEGMGADVDAHDVLDVIDGYVGKGYAVSRSEELALMRDTARTTGIILDPVYTGKAFYGLCAELENNSQRFRGSRVLFVHTGGLFGLYDKLDELGGLMA
jgi:D-cysteine desulfhydrase family pyridoxal phosphate-dependent enzyme